jgi:alkylation response protein AidB-like acyl-CoA dehydrogenase
MSFLLTEEQEAIRQTARGFAAEHMPVSHLRGLRDTADADGFSRVVWKQMAELGLAGITVAEKYGGAGLGFAELGLVLEECGRTLAPTPFLSTVVLGAGALELGGCERLRAEKLPAICSGDHLVAMAFEEGDRFDPYRIATRATRSGDKYVINGAKTFVFDGQVADTLIVVARLAGDPGDRNGLVVFALAAGRRGVTIERHGSVDSRSVARVVLNDVKVDEAAVLGAPGGGAALLDRLTDRAAVALSAEMLGGAREAFDRTLAYLKERKQFGVLIGSFQALKHRAAQMFCELELSKSIVSEALRAVDSDSADVALLSAAAKARLSDTYTRVAAEAVQMHGGIGVTDEHDIGLYFKRAHVAAMAFGTAAYHRDRFAALSGF